MKTWRIDTSLDGLTLFFMSRDPPHVSSFALSWEQAADFAVEVWTEAAKGAAMSNRPMAMPQCNTSADS